MHKSRLATVYMLTCIFILLALKAACSLHVHRYSYHIQVTCIVAGHPRSKSFDQGFGCAHHGVHQSGQNHRVSV